MKLLIVEDEKIERITMENAINMHFPDLLVETATSSIEALALLKRFEPDIVISDINVPGGSNGLEMISQMKKHSNALFMIVTSYGSFEYIQQAIRLGIEGFLLKPLKVEILVQNIRQLIVQHHQKEEEKQRRNILYDKLHKMMPILKRNLFYAIMQNETPYEIQTALQYLEWNVSDAICFVFHEQAFSDASLYIKVLEYQIPYLKYLYNRYEQHFILYIFKKGRFEQKEANILKEELREIFSYPTSVKVSGFISGCEHFYSLYHLALYTKYQLYFQYHDFSQEDMINLDEFSDEIISLTYENKQQELNFKMQAFQQYLDNISSHDAKETFYTFTRYLMKKIVGFPKNEMDKVLTYETIKERVQMLMEVLQGYFVQKRQNGISDKVMLYIKEHYMHQISLQSLADYLELTPFYVSRLVKEETGQTFTELLAHYRIEKSKQYLKNQHKIKEAALLSGFGDVNYFSKVFKKITGYSPKEYQRNE